MREAGRAFRKDWKAEFQQESLAGSLFSNENREVQVMEWLSDY